MNHFFRLKARKIWEKSPEIAQNILRPFFSYFKVKRALAKNIDATLIRKRSKAFERDIDAYWKRNFGRRIDPTWHYIYSNFTGQEDVRFIPQDVWSSEIHSVLNCPLHRETTYGDKNIAEFIFDKNILPIVVIKRVRGKYFDKNNNLLSKIEAFNKLIADNQEKIIKPSNLGGGARVFKIQVKDGDPFISKKVVSMTDIEEIQGDNFIVQYRIKQHPLLAEPHPWSLNTIRVNTLRFNKKIHILLVLVKFGGNESLIDNLGAGGVAIGVDRRGMLYHAGVDKNAQIHTKHPTTGYFFNNDNQVPGYLSIIDLCKKQHEKILHMDFASWDLAIQESGDPCLIEVNSNPSVWLFQFICRKTLFGDLTEDVLNMVRDTRTLKI